MDKFKKIGLIPARSGSKGLKDKNILDICGKPMISYTIEAALQTNLFSEVYVSTDSEKYAEISKNYGAKVLIRDAKLSTDTTTSFEVLYDILNNIKQQFDYFVLLQATSPLRNYKHIEEAVALFEDNFEQYDFLASVKVADAPSCLIREIKEDNSLKFFDQDYSRYRRQNYNEYQPNGAIYIAKPKEYLSNKHFYGNKSLAYYMDEMSSLQVDSKFDLEFVRYCTKCLI